ncbi:MAG: hypothetical protein Q4C96_11415 [Planctomycetia bacterium]|nr:hypothetical protein [Planctomycetia bacterium]
MLWKKPEITIESDGRRIKMAITYRINRISHQRKRRKLKLHFDDTNRTLIKGYVSVKLSDLQYRFFTFIYKRTTKSAALSELEKDVWQSEMVDKDMIHSLLKRTNSKIQILSYRFIWRNNCVVLQKCMTDNNVSVRKLI